MVVNICTFLCMLKGESKRKIGFSMASLFQAATFVLFIFLGAYLFFYSIFISKSSQKGIVCCCHRYPPLVEPIKFGSYSWSYELHYEKRIGVIVTRIGRNWFIWLEKKPFLHHLYLLLKFVANSFFTRARSRFGKQVEVMGHRAPSCGSLTQ